MLVHDTTPHLSPLTAIEHSRCGSAWPAKMAPSPAAANNRSGCAVCARGGGHLISVLTVSYPGGRTKQISLRPEQKPIVEQWLRNYRQIKATLERICELNHQRLLAERDSDR